MKKFKVCNLFFFKYFILIMSGQVYKPSRAHIWRWIHWSVAKQLLSVACDVMMCMCMYFLLSWLIVWFAVAPAWAIRSALEPIKPKPSSSILFLQACVNCAVGFCTPCIEFLWTLPFCLFFFLRMFISAARCANWQKCLSDDMVAINNNSSFLFTSFAVSCNSSLGHSLFGLSKQNTGKHTPFPCIFPQKKYANVRDHKAAMTISTLASGQKG